MYAVDTLSQVAGCSLTNPCPGNLFVCPVNADASLGTPVNGTNQCLTTYPLQLTLTDTKTVLTPTGLNVLANGQYVYVSATNASGTVGYIFGYTVNGDGSLTAMNGGLPYTLAATTANTVTSLRDPVALTSDTASSVLFVADRGTNLVATFAIGSDGTLSTSGVATAETSVGTGNQPSAMTLFADKYLYVTNSGDSTVNGYSFSGNALTLLASNASDTQPIAIMSDPRQLGFLYTVNFLGNSLSGYQIDPNTGLLINTQNTPYASSVQPTAIAGIPHGGKARASSTSTSQ